MGGISDIVFRGKGSTVPELRRIESAKMWSDKQDVGGNFFMWQKTSPVDDSSLLVSETKDVPVGDLFDEFDTDGDGSLTKEQVMMLLGAINGDEKADGSESEPDASIKEPATEAPKEPEPTQPETEEATVLKPGKKEPVEPETLPDAEEEEKLPVEEAIVLNPDEKEEFVEPKPEPEEDQAPKPDSREVVNEETLSCVDLVNKGESC